MIYSTQIDFIYFVSAVLVGFAFLWNYIIAEGEILEKVGKAIGRLPKWIGKPLGGCVVCQNFWTSLIASGVICIYESNIFYLSIVPLSFGLLLFVNGVAYSPIKKN